MQLFELFAKFTVDKQDFVKDMAEAEKTGQTTATKLSSSFDRLKKVLIGVVSVAAAKKAASAMMNVVAAAASVGDRSTSSRRRWACRARRIKNGSTF